MEMTLGEMEMEMTLRQFLKFVSAPKITKEIICSLVE